MNKLFVQLFGNTPGHSVTDYGLTPYEVSALYIMEKQKRPYNFVWPLIFFTFKFYFIIQVESLATLGL